VGGDLGRGAMAVGEHGAEPRWDPHPRRAPRLSGGLSPNLPRRGHAPAEPPSETRASPFWRFVAKPPSAGSCPRRASLRDARLAFLEVCRQTSFGGVMPPPSLPPRRAPRLSGGLSPNLPRRGHAPAEPPSETRASGALEVQRGWVETSGVGRERDRERDRNRNRNRNRNPIPNPNPNPIPNPSPSPRPSPRPSPSPRRRPRRRRNAGPRARGGG
jgi:hypothetical protein